MLKLDSKHLHHAYLCVGGEGVIDTLEKCIESDLDFTTKSNPDYWKESFSTLGIDESRRIIETHLGRPLSHDKRIFVIFTESITREAQNSLLKLLEEPTPSTHFFIIVPNVDILLPTVLSRMMVLGISKSKVAENEEAARFLNATPKERLKIVSALVENKQINQIRTFLDGLELEAKGHFRDPRDAHRFLRTIIDVRKYVFDRGASTKILLEHLVLIQ
jgi:DNA polymerase III delta prime subunit